MKVVLKVIEGPHQGKTFVFEGRDTFIVGRGTTANFQPSPKDKFFSRNHFLIEVNPPLCRLLDLNSLNGTYVNDLLATGVDLHDGDQIRGGDTIIAVSIEQPDVNALDVPAPGEPLPVGQLPTLVPRGRGAPVAADDSVTLPTIRPQRGAAGSPTPATPPAEIGAGSQSLSKVESQSTINPAAGPDSLPQFPGFRTVREVGRGGMGIVYEGIALRDRSRVAIKAIAPNVPASQEDLSRFIREATILRDLDHPHIVKCHDLSQDGERLFIVMDYIDGTNAEALVTASVGDFPVRRAVALVGQLLEALAYAHSRGYVHRDVKPANLLISTRQGVDHLALADFGLARTFKSSRLSGLTMTGDIGGTTPFMPPEQITNYRQVGAAADQYSAAATLYYLLTKRHVYDFPRDVAKQLLMVLQDDPLRIDQRRSDLPPNLVTAIHKALSRNPAARFPDVEAFHNTLRSCSNG